MTVLQEIRKVGFANWVWWVFWCNRNEFHPRLNLDIEKCFKIEALRDETTRVSRERSLAHYIDLTLNG